jgi:hypothetical protein
MLIEAAAGQTETGCFQLESDSACFIIGAWGEAGLEVEE